MRTRIERIGAAFLDGYHTTLRAGDNQAIAKALAQYELELRGFAFEGAAMALALLDALAPWRARRLGAFLRDSAQAHAYMVHVGAGWAWARLPWTASGTRRQLEPLLGWLAYDGWGFHEGFFHWRKYLPDRPAPRRLAGYGARAFDQGLGRSWWFVNGANLDLLSSTVEGFPHSRQADMWSGIGLAATYAGIVDEATLRSLGECAGSFGPCLAQGAAFAAKARQRAGNPAEHTELACQILCSSSATEAAALCDLTLENLPLDGSEPAYEIWRQRLQDHFRATRSAALPAALDG